MNRLLLLVDTIPEDAERIAASLQRHLGCPVVFQDGTGLTQALVVAGNDIRDRTERAPRPWGVSAGPAA